LRWFNDESNLSVIANKDFEFVIWSKILPMLQRRFLEAAVVLSTKLLFIKTSFPLRYILSQLGLNSNATAI
jgi:hypothetical protein